MEPVFHPDSYGYRPGKSAIEAVHTARERCLRYDWVLDLDVQAYFEVRAAYMPGLFRRLSGSPQRGPIRLRRAVS